MSSQAYLCGPSPFTATTVDLLQQVLKPKLFVIAKDIWINLCLEISDKNICLCPGGGGGRQHFLRVLWASNLERSNEQAKMIQTSEQMSIWPDLVNNKKIFSSDILLVRVFSWSIKMFYLSLSLSLLARSGLLMTLMTTCIKVTTCDSQFSWIAHWLFF